MKVRFAEFVLDTAARGLTRGGGEVHLSNKAFDLLSHLVRNAPSALTKDELYEHLWGQAIVEEVNLANLVSEIRAALGDTRKSHRFLKTIHAYGYAFVADVTTCGRGVSPDGGRPPHAFALLWHRDELPLREGETIIGRDAGSDLVIDAVSVSRSHAMISVEGAGATIEDLGSKNGTFVRGVRINGPVMLEDGDDVKIGLVFFSFRAVDRDGTTVTGLPVPGDLQP